MNVRDWHPGKIGLMWAGYTFLLWLLWESYCFGVCGYGTLGYGPVREGEIALLLWAVLAIPGVVITWRWLSAREKK